MKSTPSRGSAVARQRQCLIALLVSHAGAASAFELFRYLLRLWLEQRLRSKQQVDRQHMMDVATQTDNRAISLRAIMPVAPHPKMTGSPGMRGATDVAIRPAKPTLRGFYVTPEQLGRVMLRSTPSDDESQRHTPPPNCSAPGAKPTLNGL